MPGRQNDDAFEVHCLREPMTLTRAAPLRFVACAFAALGLLALASCTTLDRTTMMQPPSDDTREILRSSVRYQKEYLLFPGDQIEVLVWRNAEVSRQVIVRPDGYISLPLLQEVKAAGLTPKELAAEVSQAYSKRLINPEVTVIPMAVRQPMVYVLGDVRTPGAYPARNTITVAQALAAAGGALRTGSENATAIIRLDADGYLTAIPVGGSPTLGQTRPMLSLSSVLLKPDDVVFVPETDRSQFFRALSDFLIPLQIYTNFKLVESIVN